MNTKNIERLLYAMVAVVTVLALFGVSQGAINFVVSIFVSIIVGALISLVVGSLIEAFTGDMLKGILIPVEIMGLEFSVSLFFIATIVFKFMIFH